MDGRPFTSAELAYLRSQRLGRLATAAPDGALQNNPVGFTVNRNAEHGRYLRVAPGGQQEVPQPPFQPERGVRGGRHCLARPVAGSWRRDPWHRRGARRRRRGQRAPAGDPDLAAADRQLERRKRRTWYARSRRTRSSEGGMTSGPRCTRPRVRSRLRARVRATGPVRQPRADGVRSAVDARVRPGDRRLGEADRGLAGRGARAGGTSLARRVRLVEPARRQPSPSAVARLLRPGDRRGGVAIGRRDLGPTAHAGAQRRAVPRSDPYVARGASHRRVGIAVEASGAHQGPGQLGHLEPTRRGDRAERKRRGPEDGRRRGRRRRGSVLRGDSQHPLPPRRHRRHGRPTAGGSHRASRRRRGGRAAACRPPCPLPQRDPRSSRATVPSGAKSSERARRRAAIPTR